MAKIINTTFKLKNGPATNWTNKNPVLAAGEPGFEINTGKLKIGNGIDAYNDLPYIGGNAGAGSSGGADWNAAEGELGYIANKPFHSGEKIAEDIEFDILNIPEDVTIVNFEMPEGDIEAYGDDEEDDAENPYHYIKVSDLIPTKEDLINGILTYISISDYSDMKVTGTIEQVTETNNFIGVDWVNWEEEDRESMPRFLYVIKENNTFDTFQGFSLNFKEKGIYFLYMNYEDDGEIEIQGVSHLSFNEKGLKKIDEKFLSVPDWEAQEGEEGYIKNKPFGYKEIFPGIEWQPVDEQEPDFEINIEDLGFSEEEMERFPMEKLSFFKVSDNDFRREDLQGSQRAYINEIDLDSGYDYGSSDFSVSEHILIDNNEITVIEKDNGLPVIIVSHKNNVEYCERIIETKGVYFMKTLFSMQYDDQDFNILTYVSELDEAYDLIKISEEFLPVGRPNYDEMDPDSPNYINCRPYVDWTSWINISDLGYSISINGFTFKLSNNYEKYVDSSQLKSIAINNYPIYNISQDTSNDMHLLVFDNIANYDYPIYLKDNVFYCNSDFTESFNFNEPFKDKDFSIKEYLRFTNVIIENETYAENDYYFKWNSDEMSYIPIEEFDCYDEAIRTKKLPVVYYCQEAGDEWIGYQDGNDWYGETINFPQAGYWVLYDEEKNLQVTSLEMGYYHNTLPFAKKGQGFNNSETDEYEECPSYSQVKQYIEDNCGSSTLEFGDSWVIASEYEGYYIPSGRGIKNYIDNQGFITSTDLNNQGFITSTDLNNQGQYTNASGNYSHAEGYFSNASGNYSHAEGYKTKASREYSHAEGSQTTASGSSSHAEGFSTNAFGYCSHAEGQKTNASGNYSHAEGINTNASGNYSHAEGDYTNASGNYSHAEGYYTNASGDYSHAEGTYTIANSFQHVSGKYNLPIVSENVINTSSSTESRFIIGNGTGEDTSQRKNAFTVYCDDSIYMAGHTYMNGADYAEFLEWEDGNQENEDRRGLFVTTNEDKIKLASENDFILGIISGTGSIIGNSHKEIWQGRYLTDIFGEKIYEEIEVPEKEEIEIRKVIEMETITEIDEETGEERKITKPVEKEEEVKTIVPAYTMRQPVINPEYNPEQEYLGRDQRKEWAAVGMLGMIVAVDDGTCVSNGFCKCGGNGVATAAETGYRVLKRLDENHIKIFFK